eukprot:3783090-Rhodomonas_salina.1
MDVSAGCGDIGTGGDGHVVEIEAVVMVRVMTIDMDEDGDRCRRRCRRDGHGAPPSTNHTQKKQERAPMCEQDTTAIDLGMRHPPWRTRYRNNTSQHSISQPEEACTRRCIVFHACLLYTSPSPRDRG